MSLVQKITEDMKTAMKSGDKARLEVIRFAISGLQSAQKEKELKDPGATLTDEEAISVLQKDAKRRKESIELFKQGGRNDLVEQEAAQLVMLSEYLPKELSREEIVAMVDEAKAAGANDFPSLMREVSKLTKGRADGKIVGEVVKEKLAA